MMSRCSRPTLHPSYKRCRVSSEFSNFQIFADWCNSQFNFMYVDHNGDYFQLDKDLLRKRNDTYSSSTCTFVPREVNMFLVKRNGKRGDMPIGVCYRAKQNNYEANCNIGNGKQVYLGTYSSSEEAFMAYKLYKEKLARKLSDKYRGLLTDQAYKALKNYEVHRHD